MTWPLKRSIGSFPAGSSATSRKAKGKAKGERQRETAWAKAEVALAVAERREAAYRRAVAALELFRPDGLVNDRLWALPGLKNRLVENVNDCNAFGGYMAFMTDLHPQIHGVRP